MAVNVGALAAVVVLAIAFLAIFGSLYRGAVHAFARGELDAAGVRILRRAVIGQLVIYVLLALTAFLTIPPGPPS